MSDRQPMDMRGISLMVLLCLIWSIQQVVLKLTAADFPPTFQIALRSGIAAVLVAIFIYVRGERISFANGIWIPGLIAGLLFSVEYIMVGESLRFTSVAHSIIFLYTAPIWAALTLHWKLPSERLSPLQWLGILLAFSGIVVTFMLRTEAAPANLPNMLLGDFLALMAGILWGLTTFVIRTTRLSTLPASQTLFYQLATAFIVMTPAAYLLGQATFNPTPAAIGSLLYQSVIVGFASFLGWFWLLRNYIASRVGVFTFMTPLFGVVLGAWLLDEPIEPVFLIGAWMVLAGVILVSGHAWIAQLRKPA